MKRSARTFLYISFEFVCFLFVPFVIHRRIILNALKHD